MKEKLNAKGMAHYSHVLKSDCAYYPGKKFEELPKEIQDAVEEWRMGMIMNYLTLRFEPNLTFVEFLLRTKKARYKKIEIPKWWY